MIIHLILDHLKKNEKINNKTSNNISMENNQQDSGLDKEESIIVQSEPQIIENQIENTPIIDIQTPITDEPKTLPSRNQPKRKRKKKKSFYEKHIANKTILYIIACIIACVMFVFWIISQINSDEMSFKISFDQMATGDLYKINYEIETLPSKAIEEGANKVGSKVKVKLKEKQGITEAYGALKKTLFVNDYLLIGKVIAIDDETATISYPKFPKIINRADIEFYLSQDGKVRFNEGQCDFILTGIFRGNTFLKIKSID